jgi:fatty acid desaturase
MKITLSTNDLRRLSMVSSGRGVAALVFEWLAIAAAIVLCESAGRPVLLMALTTVWIGARLHALGVLMHEATHHRLVEARWLNEALGEVFCGWPLFVSLESYRQNHLAHHQNVNSALDPDWVRKQKPDWIFPKTRLQLAWLLMRDALGLNLFDHLRGVSEMSKRSDKWSLRSRARWLVYLSVVTFGIASGAWPLLLLYWLLPTLTWLQLVLRIRSIAEHFGLNGSLQDATRTTYASFFEGLFLAPHNVGYHLDHHLFPSVPGRHLAELHQLLLRDESFRDQAHISSSYWAVLRECTAN